MFDSSFSLKYCEGFFWHFNSLYLMTVAHLLNRRHVRKSGSVSLFFSFSTLTYPSIYGLLIFFFTIFSWFIFYHSYTIFIKSIANQNKQKLKRHWDHLRPIFLVFSSPEWEPFMTFHRCKTTRKPIFVKLSFPSLFFSLLFGRTQSRICCWHKCSPAEVGTTFSSHYCL